MNKCTLLVQILNCRRVKTNSHKNPVIQLKARFRRRKKLATIYLTLWNRQALAIFKVLKKFDYVIVEGKLHKNSKKINVFATSKQQNLRFSVSRIFKYKSLLKNKDVDLFIK